MKRVGYDIKNTLKRFATVITTTVVGLTFVLVSSAAAVPVDKQVLIIKKPEVVKIVKPEVVKFVKPEAEDSKAFFDRDRVFFNRGLFADRDRVFFERRPFFFFNPFFDFDAEFFEED
ncbi:MAG: hypothetical protein FD174_657 [Geobacteraceae bacterium]|nr:MAG: hypothetical protein FD174_657 [Geobacteraceae bacterium]